jgi:hypothetical protein
MTNDRDDAEFLDGDVLGEEVGDDDMPGSDFPPDSPLGVDDPSRDVDDDVATRELRRDVQTSRGEGFTLLQEGSVEGLMDTEAQELGQEVDAPDADLSPEEQALHIVDEDEVL